jgi:hypothetical protein
MPPSACEAVSGTVSVKATNSAEPNEALVEGNKKAFIGFSPEIHTS